MKFKINNIFAIISIVLIPCTFLQASVVVKNNEIKVISPVKNTKEQSVIDPVKTFKKYIAKHLASYKNDKREKIVLLGGGWVKEYFVPEVEYKIDVRKTNSLITPYTGFFEFTLIRYFTAFHNNKIDASKDSIFIKSNKKIHRHLYGYQENKWIVTSRMHKGSSSWYDCDEILQDGPQKGLSNLFGCWEK